MKDLTKGLLNLNLSPEQAMLLDRQAREQQIQQQTQATPDVFRGMLQQAMRTADTLQNVPRALMGKAPPMGANQRMAIKAQQEQAKKAQYEEKLKKDNLMSLKNQATAAVEGSELTDVQKSNLKKIIDMDNTGERLPKIIEKYGLPDITEDGVDQFSSINVGGMGYIYNKATGDVTAELTGVSESSSDPSVNSKSNARLSSDMDSIAKKSIESMITDKDLNPKTRAMLSKEQANFLKENPDANVRQLASHLGDVLIKEMDLQDAEQAEKARKNMRADILSSIDTLNVIADSADDMSGWEYLVLQYFPDTDAKSIKANLQKMFARISFDRLQRMREESKTGGALGSISNYEIDLLRNSLEALDPTDSEGFRRNIKRVKQHYETIMLLYSGNEEQALEYINTSPDYVLSSSGKIYHKPSNEEKPRLVGTLGG